MTFFFSYSHSHIYIDPDYFSPPIIKEDKDKIFSDAEQQKVIQLAFDDAKENHSALPLGIILLFNLGIRDGELCALKWKDVNLNSVHIRRQVVENTDKDGNVNGYKAVEHTKSKAGDRVLFLNSQAQTTLKK